MPGTGRTVFIAGAGIAGLTLALALAKLGVDVVVLERNSDVSGFGAGLQISPNARRVLDRLGLADAIGEASFEPTGIDIYPFGRERPLVTLALGPVARARYGLPYAVMHRADLADVLHAACKRFANIDIVFGVADFTVSSHAGGVSVAADLAGRSGEGFAFVGADGVHSQTRRQALGGPPARYSGRLAWRTLLPLDAVGDLVALDRTSLLLGPGYHLVAYPLPHRGLLNLALFAPNPVIDPGAESQPRRPDLPRSARSSPRISALIDLAGDGWTAWPLYAVETHHWHRGNVGLIGDAAHAMLPFQAQGAAMAIEDAAVLAPVLGHAQHAHTAFARYAQARQTRVLRVARLSQTNGTIFHMRWPLTIARDAVMRWGGPESHFHRLDWLYGYDATDDLAAGTRDA
ncbi:FAD-dependent oxidoreductase [Devosia nitrariae]|uniref:Salicylate hydroxylase n=1 Tax=Devosia nitrariae TaxID=2071872 RepID=A0ABQ5WBT8_9HYPH|nr:FAD-dependent oxidoreductase [Devosia nitrariae]GLQ57568.1 salicylate hydroxylase [Devosia nitrariae]